MCKTNTEMKCALDHLRTQKGRVFQHLNKSEMKTHVREEWTGFFGQLKRSNQAKHSLEPLSPSTCKERNGGEQGGTLGELGRSTLPQENCAVQRQVGNFKKKKHPLPTLSVNAITLKVPAGHKPHVAVDKR